MCAAILMERRQDLAKCNDSGMIFTFINKTVTLFFFFLCLFFVCFLFFIFLCTWKKSWMRPRLLFCGKQMDSGREIFCVNNGRIHDGLCRSWGILPPHPPPPISSPSTPPLCVYHGTFGRDWSFIWGLCCSLTPNFVSCSLTFDLDDVLSKAEKLFFTYCKKTVSESFQLVDANDSSKQNWSPFSAVF